jgi:hypothetical protein
VKRIEPVAEIARVNKLLDQHLHHPYIASKRHGHQEFMDRPDAFIIIRLLPLSLIHAQSQPVELVHVRNSGVVGGQEEVCGLG